MRFAEQLSPFQLDRLEDLMGYVHNMMCREAGADFLSALTDFTNLVLAGRCPEAVAPVLFGGRLLALSKKSGGIRPIAIGFTLRRLLPNVPTRLEPTNWLLISTRISWALVPLVGVKLLCILPEDT